MTHMVSCHFKIALKNIFIWRFLKQYNTLSCTQDHVLPPAPTAAADTVVRHTEKTTQLGFAYTTPCLVTGGGSVDVSMILTCP